MLNETSWTRRHDRAILALLQEANGREAARRARISQATMTRWLRDSFFTARLQREREDLFNAAKTQMLAVSAEAVGTLALAMRGERVPWTSRVQAARALLGLAVRVEENETILARLERLERGALATEGDIVQ